MGSKRRDSYANSRNTLARRRRRYKRDRGLQLFGGARQRQFNGADPRRSSARAVERRSKQAAQPLTLSKQSPSARAPTQFAARRQFARARRCSIA